MANPRGQQRDKPFRDALRKRIAEASEDPRKLDRIAEKLLSLAEAGDMQAIKEMADRLDGKAPQAIIGGDEEDGPVKLEITWQKPNGS
jgi:hypothetical protein